MEDVIAKLCYFNQTFNLYLYKAQGVDWIKRDEQLIEDTFSCGKGVLRLTSYYFDGHTFYSYGLYYNDRNQRPGHGGEWSSNSMFINERFNTDMFECSLNGIACAISRKDIFRYIDKHVFELQPSSMKDYYIIKSETIIGKYFQWYDSFGRTIKI